MPGRGGEPVSGSAVSPGTRAQREIEERLRFETLLADVSLELDSASAERAEGVIERAQGSVCECLDLDRSAIWQLEPEHPRDFLLTHLYQRDSARRGHAKAGGGSRGRVVTMEGTPAPARGTRARALFPWVAARTEQGETVVSVTLADLPDEAAADREAFRAFGYRSLVVVPLKYAGEVIGALTLIAAREEKQWPPALIMRFQVVARLFANTLARLRNEEAMRRSEARLASAIELAGLGFYDTHRGPSHRIFADERMCALLGTSENLPESILGFWQGHIHPDDRERVLELQRGLWAGAPDTVSQEYRYLHPQRGLIWISHVARVVERDGGGQAVRLIGVLHDVTERMRARLATEEQLQFEVLLSELSASFVKLPAAEIDPGIEDAQRRICECLDLDLSALWQWSPDNPGSQALTHIYRRQPGPPVPHLMDAREYFPWCLDELSAGRPVNVSSIEETPPEAARDREVWRHYGVRSVLTIPLAAGGRPTLGSLSFNTLTAERPWPDRLVQRIRLIAEVFANALERKRAEEALRQSYAEVKRLKSQLEVENRYLIEENRLKFGPGKVVGESAAINQVLLAVEQVAPETTTVLIEGETGVGKELVARRVHELSPRGKRPMVKVNCAALPSNLVESELFGREKGAYTGSVARELGRFELADGSTIFLDEVAELPLELQAKLLRVLEQGEFERVGSPRTLRTDARVIAATNRDLEAEVKAGRFRRDLYYRLSVFPIVVPPLRERRDDIPLLMWSLIEEIGANMHKQIESVPRRVVESLKLYDWPGNVRELRNVIERALIRCSGRTLDIPLPAMAPRAESAATSLEEAQRQHISKVLEATGGRISGRGGAAEILGLRPTTLRSRMKRLGMGQPGRRPARPER
jgi:formate hydrogenlyase transcriptional activator